MVDGRQGSMVAMLWGARRRCGPQEGRPFLLVDAHRPCFDCSVGEVLIVQRCQVVEEHQDQVDGFAPGPGPAVLGRGDRTALGPGQRDPSLLGFDVTGDERRREEATWGSDPHP